MDVGSTGGNKDAFWWVAPWKAEPLRAAESTAPAAVEMEAAAAVGAVVAEVEAVP